jgi:hypothetical protein
VAPTRLKDAIANANNAHPRRLSPAVFIIEDSTPVIIRPQRLRGDATIG